MSDKNLRKKTTSKRKRKATLIMRAEVDLDTHPRAPFNRATIKKHVGGGKKSVIEKCLDGVYINGKKLTLHRFESKTNEKVIQGNELLLEFENMPVQNATLNDFFETRPEFVPDDWKKEENGSVVWVFFGGSIFLDPFDGSEFVLCGGWINASGRWMSRYIWIHRNFIAHGPAVVVE